MKTIWHVYIDEDGKKCLGDFGGNDTLPFADCFRSMKLFESRKNAERYMNKLAKEISNFLTWHGLPKIVKLEAFDGGQFDRRINVYSAKSNSRKIVESVWIKAVARDLRK